MARQTVYYYLRRWQREGVWIGSTTPCSPPTASAPDARRARALRSWTANPSRPPIKRGLEGFRCGQEDQRPQAPHTYQTLVVTQPVLLKHGVVGVAALPGTGPIRIGPGQISNPGRAAMDHYVALDVSLKETSVCVLIATARLHSRGGLPQTRPASRSDPDQGAPGRQDRARDRSDLGLALARSQSGRSTGRVHGCQARPCRSLDPAHQVRPQRAEAWPTWCAWAGIGKCKSRAWRPMSDAHCWQPATGSFSSGSSSMRRSAAC